MTSKFEANYSSNTDANPKSGFETIVMANCILNAPLMLLSIIGNALVLVAILRTPSIRSPSVIFLCNLAVSDLLVGLVVEPAYIAEQIVRTVSALQEAVTAMGFAGCGVSLWTMTAITVDRFLALHYHLQYPNLMTTSRAIYTIVTIWCIITFSLFQFFGRRVFIIFLELFVSQFAFWFAWFVLSRFTELFSGISCKFTFNNKQWKIQLIQINSKYDNQLGVQKMFLYISSQ